MATFYFIGKFFFLKTFFFIFNKVSSYDWACIFCESSSIGSSRCAASKSNSKAIRVNKILKLQINPQTVSNEKQVKTGRVLYFSFYASIITLTSWLEIAQYHFRSFRFLQVNCNTRPRTMSSVKEIRMVTRSLEQNNVTSNDLILVLDYINMNVRRLNVTDSCKVGHLGLDVS